MNISNSYLEAMPSGNHNTNPLTC